MTPALCNELCPLRADEACGPWGGAEDVGRAEQTLEQAHEPLPGMSRPQAQTWGTLSLAAGMPLSLARMSVSLAAPESASGRRSQNVLRPRVGAGPSDCPISGPQSNQGWARESQGPSLTEAWPQLRCPGASCPWGALNLVVGGWGAGMERKRRNKTGGGGGPRFVQSTTTY